MRRNPLVAVFLVLAVGCLDRPPAQPLEDPNAPVEPRLARGFNPLTDTLVSPVRMARTPLGDLLVSDSRRQTIVIVDATTHQPLRVMDVHGTPLAVGLLGNRIFVGNATTSRIEVYNARGEFQYAFAQPVEYPTDLAVDAQLGLVFVADAGAPDVKVFGPNGDLQRVISGPAAEPAAQLHLPTGITLDTARQEVLVSDYPDATTGGNAAIRIFDYQGTLHQVLSPGRCGSIGCSGGFSRPQGLAIDERGRIYVADALLAAVLVFARDSLTLVKTLGGRNVGPPALRVPLDVVIGRNSDVLVTSNRTGSVEAFRGGALP